ncbi:DUF169 domain-containing protein [Methanobrevibacter sp. OttesenSCG-928-I08]|nr:DUF169 domain-containing protein [Methanobrevibacter sp. OttesenSCG-928-I08]
MTEEILKVNQKHCNDLKEKLNLDNFPVAIKFINSEEEVPKGINKIDRKIRHCEMVKASSFGEKFYATANEQACKGGSASLGLEDFPEKLIKGETYFKLGRFKDLETSKNTMSELSVIEKCHYGIVYAPLNEANFKVDVVVIIGKAVTGMKIAQSIVHSSGTKVKPSFAGIQSLCGDIVSEPYNSGDVNISLGCDGSRKNAELKDEELIIGISNDKLEEIMNNLNTINK